MIRSELDAAGVHDPSLREAYEHCRMLNAEHGKTFFLATRLLAPEQRPAVHALYFRHLLEDRWLRRDQVGFVAAAGTPMGYDLGAVAREAPGALSYEAAQHQVQERRRP